MLSISPVPLFLVTVVSGYFDWSICNKLKSPHERTVGQFCGNTGPKSFSVFSTVLIAVDGGHLCWSFCKKNKSSHERTVLTQYLSKVIQLFLRIVPLFLVTVDGGHFGWSVWKKLK